MAPKYKLTYFNGYGAGEHIRYIFAYANQDYEDVRIEQDEWQTIKPTTPFGKLPILEIDGKIVSQSLAIARYLAKQFGLAGKDDWESLQCDVLVDTFKDFFEAVLQIFFEANAEKKEEMKKKFIETDIPFYFTKFDKIVADHPDGNLVGSQLTWADLFFATNLDVMESSKPGILKSYPALESLLKKVHSNPGIKAWIEKRPANTFTLPIN